MTPDVRRIAILLSIATALTGPLAWYATRPTPPPAASTCQLVDMSPLSDATPHIERAPASPPVLEPAPTPEASPPPASTLGDGWCASVHGLDLEPVEASRPLTATIGDDVRLTLAVPTALELDHVAATPQDDPAWGHVRLFDPARPGRAVLEFSVQPGRTLEDQLQALGVDLAEVQTRQVRTGGLEGTEVCGVVRDVFGRRMSRKPDGGRGPCHPMVAGFLVRTLIVPVGDVELVAHLRVRSAADPTARASASAAFDSIVVDAADGPVVD